MDHVLSFQSFENQYKTIYLNTVQWKGKHFHDFILSMAFFLTVYNAPCSMSTTQSLVFLLNPMEFHDSFSLFFFNQRNKNWFRANIHYTHLFYKWMLLENASSVEHTSMCTVHTKRSSYYFFGMMGGIQLVIYFIKQTKLIGCYSDYVLRTFLRSKYIYQKKNVSQ